MQPTQIQLSSITARDVIRGGIVACDPAFSLTEVAGLMAANHIHCLVVDGIRADEHGEHLVWSIVSDLDVIRAAVLAGQNATAGEIAATEALTVDAGDDLVTVAAALSDHGVSHAVVVEGERPAGIISTLDIMGVLAP